jgi:hypothetical protein
MPTTWNSRLERLGATPRLLALGMLLLSLAPVASAWSKWEEHREHVMLPVAEAVAQLEHHLEGQQNDATAWHVLAMVHMAAYLRDCDAVTVSLPRDEGDERPFALTLPQIQLRTVAQRLPEVSLKRRDHLLEAICAWDRATKQAQVTPWAWVGLGWAFFEARDRLAVCSSIVQDPDHHAQQMGFKTYNESFWIPQALDAFRKAGIPSTPVPHWSTMAKRGPDLLYPSHPAPGDEASWYIVAILEAKTILSEPEQKELARRRDVAQHFYGMAPLTPFGVRDLTHQLLEFVDAYPTSPEAVAASEELFRAYDEALVIAPSRDIGLPYVDHPAEISVARMRDPAVFKVAAAYLENHRKSLQLLDSALRASSVRIDPFRDMSRGEIGLVYPYMHLEQLLLLKSLVESALDKGDAWLDTLHSLRKLAETLGDEPDLFAQLTRYRLWNSILDAIELVTTQSVLSRAQMAAAETLLHAENFRHGLSRGYEASLLILPLVPRHGPHQFSIEEVGPGIEAILTDLEKPFPDTFSSALRFEREDMRHVGGSAVLRMTETTARIRAARAALAVEQHRLKYGTLPERLEETADEFPPAILEDPFTGGPLRYLRSGDGFIVYSVGKDQMDDAAHRVNPVEDLDVVFTVRMAQPELSYEQIRTRYAWQGIYEW